MRILAIRGENLASLEGRFEVALDQPPLANSGLFAITGPTGAGKTTLLDALCLALFHTTPRLAAHKGAPLSAPEEAELLSNNPKTLLRRGSVSGFAEVEFQGVDGKRYRARWSVRRARGKAGGAPQDPQAELREIASGGILGRTRTEVLDEIETRLGLSFPQFRRSVLLAQGEFAAFLHAQPPQRAELLERVTGTEVFGDLSKAAHFRAKTESEALDELTDALGRLHVLPDHERAALAERTDSLGQVLGAAQARLEEAARVRHWHTERAKLLAGERQAERALVDASAALERAGPLAAQLEAVVAAQPLRNIFDRADRASAEAGRAREAASAATLEATTAASQAQVAAAAHRAAADRVSAAERRAEQARPEIALAREVDTLARSGEEQLSELRARLSTAERSVVEADAAASGLEAALTVLEGQRSDAASWLAARENLRPLATQWTRWRSQVLQFGELSRRTAGVAGALAGLASTEAAARRAVLDDAAREDRELLARDQERARADRARQESDRVDRAALRREREALASRRDALSALAAAAAQAAQLADERSGLETAMAAAESGSRAAALSRDSHRAELVELETRLEEARRSRDLARSARDLDSHRASLRDGEPCPLCGSLEHPWRGLSSPLEGLLAEAENRVRELGSRRDALLQLEASASRLDESQRREALRLETERERLATVTDGLQGDWTRFSPLAGGPLPPLAGAPSSSRAAGALLAGVEASLESLKTSQSIADALAQHARRAADLAGSAVSEARREQASTMQACERCIAELEPILAVRPDARSDLAADPARFLDDCEREVRSLENHERSLADATRALERSRPEADRARSSAAALAAESAQLSQQHARASEALEVLRARRAGLLGGATADDVEARLSAEQRQSLTALDVAREEARKAESTREVALARQSDANLSESLAAGRRDLAEAALAEALAAGGLSLDAARQLLSFDGRWQKHRRAELAAFEQACQRAAAVLAERRGARLIHEAELPLEAGAEEAERLFREAETAAHVARDAYHGSKAELDIDTNNRQAAVQLSPQLETQRASFDRWKRLSDVIGSESGAKFRAFAQSLTLDLLLAHANRHLQELARRYRLMRVARRDLDLQVVDLEMGEEVRSVHSLSGGESFLVSLALALGLASLSARDATVESLFIDEGLGSLDQETLEIALATLDSLQATGRQVGLISHVPGLAERIGAQVRVTPRGNGKSTVTVEGTDGPCSNGPAWSATREPPTPSQ
ncbi:MAG: AAA family ATPase [Candidatus Wallbacteria bacterium]|nr:AAA family ATPase [Candidatus Wallbacteria bacterium]